MILSRIRPDQYTDGDTDSSRWKILDAVDLVRGHDFACSGPRSYFFVPLHRLANKMGLLHGQSISASSAFGRELMAHSRQLVDSIQALLNGQNPPYA